MYNILNDVSYYDKLSKLPIPNLDYIRGETGENMAVNLGSEEKAKAFVKQITKTSWSLLAQTKTNETANKLQYLITTNKEYRIAFLELVASFIFDIFMTGSKEFFETTNQDDLSKTLSAKTRSFMNSGLLAINDFTYFNYDRDWKSKI